VHDRKVQPAREIVGLVEAAKQPPDRMQRHRHRHVRALEDLAAMAAHQRTKVSRQRSPAVILQRLDDRAQRAVVGSDCPRS
jgi:hypothetical protein